jgi:hypothetical protein
MGGRGIMNIFDIHIAFMSWGDGGKRRPVLIIDENADSVTVFNITTKYESKSEKIRTKYFLINDWKQSGLDVQSYIDTNITVTLPATAIDSKSPIGRLSAEDEMRLMEFIDR